MLAREPSLAQLIHAGKQHLIGLFPLGFSRSAALFCNVRNYLGFAFHSLWWYGYDYKEWKATVLWI